MINFHNQIFHALSGTFARIQCQKLPDFAQLSRVIFSRFVSFFAG